MSNHSTIPAVKAALRQRVADRLPGVQVSYGQPMDTTRQREVVWVGSVSGTQTVPVITGGRKRREEDYTITVTVAVVRPRGTPEDAEARLFDLADDPSLGGVDGLVHAYADGPVDADVEFGSEGPVAWLTFSVHCLTRLT
jgi:hypothetical protein